MTQLISVCDNFMHISWTDDRGWRIYEKWVIATNVRFSRVEMPPQ